jgi:hypothetical protein
MKKSDIPTTKDAKLREELAKLNEEVRKAKGGFDGQGVSVRDAKRMRARIQTELTKRAKEEAKA